MITLNNIKSHFKDAFKLYFDQKVEIFRYLPENRCRPPGQSWSPAATVIMLSDEVIFLDTVKPFSFVKKDLVARIPTKERYDV